MGTSGTMTNREMLERLQPTIFTDVDGYAYFWPTGEGCFTAYHLRVVADELDRRNTQVNKPVPPVRTDTESPDSYVVVARNKPNYMGVDVYWTGTSWGKKEDATKYSPLVAKDIANGLASLWNDGGHDSPVLVPFRYVK